MLGQRRRRWPNIKSTRPQITRDEKCDYRLHLCYIYVVFAPHPFFVVVFVDVHPVPRQGGVLVSILDVVDLALHGDPVVIICGAVESLQVRLWKRKRHK